MKIIKNLVCVLFQQSFIVLILNKKISILSRSLKQDLVLNTEINDDNKIYIDGQPVIVKIDGHWRVNQ